MINSRVPTPFAYLLVAIFGFFFVSVIQIKIQTSIEIASALSSISDNSNLGKQNPTGGQPVIKEKVFLFAGMQDNGVPGGTNQLNDTWVTSNMSSWTPLLQNGHSLWSGRSGFGAVYFDNKIWMIAGRKANPQGGSTVLINEVWKTSDGLNFEHVDFNSNLPGVQNPNWAPRLATNSVIVFDDGTGAKIWLVGGYTENGLPKNDVWDFDGISWVQKNSLPSPTNSFNASKFAVESLGGQIIVAGYLSSGNTIKYNPTTSSWMTTSYVGNYLGQTLSKNGSKLYSLGGKLGNSNTSAIISTNDGVTWNTLSSGSWSGRSLHKSVNFMGKLWVVGGFANNALSEIWSYAPDKNTWNQIVNFKLNGSSQTLASPPWLERKEFGLVVTPASFGNSN